MIVELRERGGWLARDQMADDPSLTRLINSAIHDLETKQSAGWPWLRRTDVPVTLTNGTGLFTFASLSGADTWLKVRSARILYGATWQPLIPMNAQSIRSSYPSTAPAMPYAWATDGYQLLVRPVPNDDWVATIDVVISEPDLVDPADSPLMPATFHSTIIEQAMYKQARRAGANALVQSSQQAVAQGLADMRAFARTATGPARASQRDPWG